MSYSEQRASVKSHTSDWSRYLALVFADDISMFTLLGYKRGKSRVKVEHAKRVSGDGARSSSAAEVVDDGVSDNDTVKHPPKKPRASAKRPQQAFKPPPPPPAGSI